MKVQKLHLVGFTSDREGLVFSARKGTKTGRFVIPVDDELVASVQEAQRVRNGSEPERRTRVGREGGEAEAAPRAESMLTPREIQARVRAGWSIDDVAKEAGVDAEWVERFAVPVLAEQELAVQRAQELVYSKPRLGQSAQPLRTSVLWNVLDKGLRIVPDEFDAHWSAYQRADGTWAVRFRYVSRGRVQEAEWDVDFDAGQLTSCNALASRLAYVARGRRRHAPVVEEAPAAPRPRATRHPSAAKKRPTAKRAAPAKRATTTKRTAAKRATTTKQVAPRKRATKKTARATKKTARATKKTARARRAR
jgi:hypothetical protein